MMSESRRCGSLWIVQVVNNLSRVCKSVMLVLSASVASLTICSCSL